MPPGDRHAGAGSSDLVPNLIPQYPLGGKRVLRDDGLWIAALKHDNVELVTAPITRITETGIVTGDGRAT